MGSTDSRGGMMDNTGSMPWNGGGSYGVANPKPQLQPLDKEEERERRRIREQDRIHQPFNDPDAGRLSDDEPEVARMKQNKERKSKEKKKRNNNFMMTNNFTATNSMMQTNFAAMSDSMGFSAAADQPKAARNMGFPDMRYLDPEAKGQPIQEKTLYK
jgi:hypothetical protein